MVWHDDVGWWAWLTMSLGMVIFWGLVVWGLALLLRGRGGTLNAERPSPEKILDERLARGEIDEREYRRRLEALHSNDSLRQEPVS